MPTGKNQIERRGLLEKVATAGVIGSGIVAGSGTASANDDPCYPIEAVIRDDCGGYDSFFPSYEFETASVCEDKYVEGFDGNVLWKRTHESGPGRRFYSVGINGGCVEFRKYSAGCTEVGLPRECYSMRECKMTARGEGDYIVLGANLDAYPVDAARFGDTTPILHADGRHSAKLSYVQTTDQVIDSVEVTYNGKTTGMSGLIGGVDGKDVWKLEDRYPFPSIVILGGDVTLEFREW